MQIEKLQEPKAIQQQMISFLPNLISQRQRKQQKLENKLTKAVQAAIKNEGLNAKANFLLPHKYFVHKFGKHRKVVKAYGL